MKWIIIIAFFAASCGKKQKCWTCEGNRGSHPVCNMTKSEIKDLEKKYAHENMKCH